MALALPILWPELEASAALFQAVEVGRGEFEMLVSDDRIRRRLTALAGDQLRARRLANRAEDPAGNR